MPVKNVTRLSVPESYYHIYNRGVNKRAIFLDDADYHKFLSLFDRYLNPKESLDHYGRSYKRLTEDVDVLAFCLMPNHFHFLVYQKTEDGLASLMLSVCTAYTMYFNKKYNRRGPLFESSYKACLISTDEYLMHITRYIHMNPKNFKSWKYSSYREYLGVVVHKWLSPEPIMDLFSSKKEYKEFIDDYQDMKRTLEQVKSELADR